MFCSVSAAMALVTYEMFMQWTPKEGWAFDWCQCRAWQLLAYRLAEVIGRVSLVAVFAVVTEPYFGGFCLLATTWLAVSIICVRNQRPRASINTSILLSVLCLVARHTCLTGKDRVTNWRDYPPAWKPYYTLRFVEALIMIVAVLFVGANNLCMIFLTVGVLCTLSLYPQLRHLVRVSDTHTEQVVDPVAQREAWFQAVAQGNLSAVQAAVNHGDVQLETCDAHGRNALQIAALRDYEGRNLCVMDWIVKEAPHLLREQAHVRIYLLRVWCSVDVRL
jgi:hypothetical protein